MEGCLYRGYTAHLNTRAVLDAAQQCQCPLVLSSVTGCVRRGSAAAATGATVDSAGASALKESTFSLTADLGRSYKESGAETSMKRSSAERDAFGSRVHGRQPPSVVDVKGSVGRTNVELEGDDAQRLTALRSLRRKHNKPEDWMTGTFHQYDISDVVGAGTFGQVYKATRTSDGKLVALKCIKQEDGDGKGFPVTAIREMRILRQLRHKNIVDLMEVIIDGNPTPGRLSTVALVFEYLDHDLSGLLDTPEAASQITPALAKSYMLQLIEGVAYMHSKQIIHRDLKGANLLISNAGHLKIADWGLARRLYEMQDKYTTKVITLWYRPPELLLKAALYGPPVDMWSVGCIVAELLTRSALFPGSSESDQLGLIFDTVGTPTSQNWPAWRDLPEYDHWRESVRESPRSSKLRERFWRHGDVVLDLLVGLLTLDPMKRLTAKQALNHRYFQVKPLPSVPGMVALNLHSCHEYEAKIRKKESRKGGKVSYNAPVGASKTKDKRTSFASKSVPVNHQQQQQQKQKQQQRTSNAHNAQPHGLQISLPQVALVGHARPGAAHPHHAHHPINNLVLHATSSGRTPPLQARLPPHQPASASRGSQNWGRDQG